MRRVPSQLMSQQLGLNFPVRGGPTRLPPNMMGSPIRELPRTGFPLGMPSQQQQAMQDQAFQRVFPTLNQEQQNRVMQERMQQQQTEAMLRQYRQQAMQQPQQQGIASLGNFAQQQPQYAQQIPQGQPFQAGAQQGTLQGAQQAYQQQAMQQPQQYGQPQQQGQPMQQNTAQPQPFSGYGNYGMR